MKMKIYLLIPVLAILFASCGGDSKKTELTTDIVNLNKGEAPVMTFEKELHDFGKITQGEKVSYIFKFKNTGKSSLIISSASASCGCTVPEYSKEPIAPGADGQVEVKFNSESKQGVQSKTVTLVTNCEPNNVMIKIAAEVIVPTEVNQKDVK